MRDIYETLANIYILTYILYARLYPIMERDLDSHCSIFQTLFLLNKKIYHSLLRTICLFHSEDFYIVDDI